MIDDPCTARIRRLINEKLFDIQHRMRSTLVKMLWSPNFSELVMPSSNSFPGANAINPSGWIIVKQVVHPVMMRISVLEPILTIDRLADIHVPQL